MAAEMLLTVVPEGREDRLCDCVTLFGLASKFDYNVAYTVKFLVSISYLDQPIFQLIGKDEPEHYLRSIYLISDHPDHEEHETSVGKMLGCESSSRGQPVCSIIAVLGASSDILLCGVLVHIKQSGMPCW